MNQWVVVSCERRPGRYTNILQCMLMKLLGGTQPVMM